MDVIGNMNNKICFFGASITQQGNGYWKYFAENNKQFSIHQFGYGARHLSDAGICYIDKVLEVEPEYCFIDWFSTGYIKYNEHKFDEIKEYIDTIIYKFFIKNVKLIFLIFPDKTVDKTYIYNEIKKYIQSLNIPILDISESFDNIDEILRDGIHTTDYGAKEYAKKIQEYFYTEIYDKYQITYKPHITKYCDIKQYSLNKIITKKLIISGNSEVIGISQYVGPYSGLIKINDEIINNWDKWCHYEREMINLKFKIDGITTIEVLQNEFDKSSCPTYTECNVKILKLMTIFYIGEKIKILDYN
jgi:hypothetical protein